MIISYIYWEVIDIESNKIIVFTSSWVWYDLFISDNILSSLSLNSTYAFYVYHSISENSQSLFGFLEKRDKQVFEELIKISWIWWKVAIYMLSLWWDNLIKAISLWDNRVIEWIKWIWKKMAEKIILELKDRDFVKNTYISDFKWEDEAQKTSKSLKDNIISTLSNMGYDKNSIEKALLDIPKDIENIEDIIPAVIKKIW